MPNTPEQLADVIVTSYEEQCLSADELRRLIADAIKEARDDGMNMEREPWKTTA